MKTKDESAGATIPVRKGGGWYLYAVLPADAERTLTTTGLGGAEVTFVVDGAVMAAVSRVAEGEKLRPERRNLAAHQGVLKALMVDASILPVAFGIVADDEESLRRIMSRNRSVFAQQLAHVKGKVEMGLRVSWDVPNIFEYFVTLHDDLRETRDRIYGARREPTQDDKIELGRLFDRVLNEERESLSERVETALSPIAAELKQNRVRSEREVMNLACLVARDQLEAFEAAVFEAARHVDDSFTFDYNGPWAPHSFVEVELKT